ncbi:hypothetical protein TcasGA2_TC031979, partial [Tribolium castaneum]
MDLEVEQEPVQLTLSFKKDDPEKTEEALGAKRVHALANMEKSLQNLKEMAAQLPQVPQFHTTTVPPKRVLNALVQTASPEEWVKLVADGKLQGGYGNIQSPGNTERRRCSRGSGSPTIKGAAGGNTTGSRTPRNGKVPRGKRCIVRCGFYGNVQQTGRWWGDCARYVLLTKAEEKGETLETWYFALEELKEAVQNLKRTRLEVMLLTKAEPICFRKLLDIVFGRTQVTVTLCIPPAPKPVSQVATTRKAVKRSATRPMALPRKGKVRKADATSTILVSNKNQEFPELFKTVKETLKNQDVGVELKAATATKRGDVLLSVGRQSPHEKGLVDAMLERGKIRVGILTGRVRPVVEVDRCARCGAITHRASQCTKGKKSCFKCGGEGHEARSCKETKVFCTSCNKEGHNASSIRCPLYSRVVSMETQRAQMRRATPPTKKLPGPIRVSGRSPRMDPTLTRGVHMKKVYLKQEKEAGKLAEEGTPRNDLSKTDALKVAAGKQTAKLDEAENPKTPEEDSSLGNINPFGRSSMTPRSPQRKVQTSLIVGQTPKLDETIEAYKETPTGAIPKRKRASTPEEAHKAFTQVTSRRAKKVKVLPNRIDDTPNIRQEIKNDAKAVCYAMADMQAMQDDVFEEIFKWQRHIQMEDSDDDVVLVESPENKGVGIQVTTQTKEVITKNAETQTPLEMWGKSTQVTEMSQAGQLREPLYIEDKRSFVDFKDLSKRDWKESYFEKVKIKAVNPLAMMSEAAPTIIRSRDKKEEGALLKLLHQRCPEYRESVLEGEDPIESKVTSIVRSVVVGHVAGPKETLKNYMFVVAGDEKNKASGYLNETYEALEELKQVLKELQIEKVAIGSDLTGREKHLRKMLEYIFRGENVEVTLCVPIAKEMMWRDQGKAQSAISVSPKGMRKTYAVIVQGSKTETYEAVLKEVRESLAETDCEIRIRKTREGKLLLLVGKEREQAKKVKEALCSKMANRKIVLRDDSTKEDKVLHVKGLDALAVETEIVSSVVAAMDGTITNTDLEVTSLRKAYGGSKVATIKVPAKTAEAILSKGKIKIGLVTCKITERVNSVFCYRCWEPGHMAARCQGVDRSKLCHRCGEEGHSAKTCEKEMFCPVCGLRDVILMSEPNVGMVHSNGWWTDDANDVAIAVMNKKIKVYAWGKGLGFVWIDTGECIIYSCYISPNVEPVIAERALRNLMGSIGSHGEVTRMGGGKTQDERRSLLSEWLATLNCVVYNNGMKATFLKGRYQSWIDVNFSTENAARQRKNRKWSELRAMLWMEHQGFSPSVIRHSFVERMNAKQNKDCVSMVEAIKEACNMHLPKKGRTRNTDTRRKKWCVLLTFDVKNAFNSANWQNIMEALRKKGISMYLRKVIGSYLSERSLDLGEGQVMEVTSGVPQGTVLGPTLWNILYDGVLRLEIPKEATLVAYADDLALVVIEKNIENLMCTVEMTSKIIGRWMKENGLQLAPETTEAVLLAGGRRPDKNVVFKVENVELRPKQNVRDFEKRLQLFERKNYSLIDWERVTYEQMSNQLTSSDPFFARKIIRTPCWSTCYVVDLTKNDYATTAINNDVEQLIDEHWYMENFALELPSQVKTTRGENDVDPKPSTSMSIYDNPKPSTSGYLEMLTLMTRMMTMMMITMAVMQCQVPRGLNFTRPESSTRNADDDNEFQYFVKGPECESHLKKFNIRGRRLRFSFKTVSVDNPIEWLQNAIAKLLGYASKDIPQDAYVGLVLENDEVPERPVYISFRKLLNYNLPMIMNTICIVLQSNRTFFTNDRLTIRIVYRLST